MKPIIFSGPMVRALLEDRKTKTRRVMQPQPVMDADGMWHWKDCQWMDGGLGFPASGIDDYAPCLPGDILWVRETYFCWVLPMGERVYRYRATDPGGNKAPSGPEYDDELVIMPWTPSIHMPRKAARLFLRVTDVRVEQVQDITTTDICDEGIWVEPPPIVSRGSDQPPDFEQRSEKEKMGWCKEAARATYIGQCDHIKSLHDAFETLWNNLNAKRGFGWDANPWVWVYTFERIEQSELHEETP